MYGNTEAVMNAVCQGLAREGTVFEVFDAARTHASYILPSLWIRKGLVVGAPTYEGALFPPVANLLELAVNKAVRHKKAALFGSYGWRGGAQRQFTKIAESGKWDLVQTMEFRGGPPRELLKQAHEFGRKLAEAVQ